MKFKNHISLGSIADLIKGKVLGNPDALVTGINEIHMVESGDITFVDHPKYYQKALNSDASFVIINKEMEAPEGKSLIFTRDPFSDYVHLTKHFRPFEASDKLISSKSKIGQNSIIQPGVFIGNNVVVGDNVIIHPGVVIYDHCIIGDNVIIHANTVIGSDAFYFKRYPDNFSKMESCGRVIIKDNVEIGAGCTIDKGVSGDTVIGEGTKFDNHIHIGHDTVIGKNCLLAAKVGIAGVVTIEDDVIIWGQVGVNKDLTIGKGAVVLAQSGIGMDLKPGVTYFGSPATEAREKMRELIAMKRIPEIIRKL